jgi:hypothetical protein
VTDTVTIRPATPQDLPGVLAFIRELAAYERLADRVQATEADLAAALFGARPFARTTLERGCARLEWTVLDWNAPSIGFYRSLGAVAQDEWTTMRVTGAALEHLARG